MDSNYHNQANLPHFSGHYRQRGSGFGALALGIGRVALPLAQIFVIPPAKKIGKELLLHAAPELIEVATNRKNPKQALNSTVRKTIKKQVGGGSRSPKIHTKRTTVVKRKTRRVILRKMHREVAPICLQGFKIISNLIPKEATHSSLDLFEKLPLLVTFENAFTKKLDLHTLPMVLCSSLKYSATEIISSFFVWK